jgi:hypothetical protein
MNFDFFKDKLKEQREYLSGKDYWWFLRRHLQMPEMNGCVELIDEKPETFYNDHFKSTHITYPSKKGGVKEVEETFAITLPDDFKSFYNEWSQALLVLREAYWIMPASGIIEATQSMRGDYDAQRPCNLIRFARLFDSPDHFFSLRRKSPSSQWKIAKVDDGEMPVADGDIGDDSADYMVTDANFTDWLKRMLETDGTPWFPGNDEEQHCKTIRLLPGESRSEALNRLGLNE